MINFNIILSLERKMLNMAKPTIGIRPIIDGRWGGVRESLEGKTMAMAQAAKALIEANVFYTDGTPVECVVSPVQSAEAQRRQSARSSSQRRMYAQRSPSLPAGATAVRRWILTH